MNLDSHLLRTFLAIVDGGSFAAAANQVCRTQSAVTMQIQRLEQVVGQSLFERGGRAVKLTPKGAVLLSYARQIIRLQSDAISELSTTPMVGKVRFGTPDDYALRILPRILSRFAIEYPMVEVEVRCETSAGLLSLLGSSALDFALISRTPERPQGDLLRKEPVVWAASPKLHIQDINPLPLAVFQADCLLRQMVTSALTLAGREYRIAYSSPNLSALLAVASAGLAIAALPESSVPPNLQVLGVAQAFPVLPTLELAIVTGKSDEREVVKAMAMAAREAIPVTGAIPV